MNLINLLATSDIKISDAAIYSLVGFIIVLAVLMLLVGIFYLSGFIFRSKLFDKSKRKPKAAAKPDFEVAGSADNDEEIVAAITAAITCIYESEAGESKVVPEFVIKRIKRNK